MQTIYISSLILLFVGAGLLGCDHGPSDKDAAPLGTTVSIVSISPDISSALQVGDSVKLRVEVQYSFTESNGTLGLVVQTADNTSLAQDMEIILKGSGKTVFEVNFEVPETKSIAVFTPVSTQGQMKTSTVDMRAYKVVDKQ